MSSTSALLRECMKLSSTNKINKQNAWQLGLIDVMETAAQPTPEDELDGDGFDDGEGNESQLQAVPARGGKHGGGELPNFARAAGVLEAAMKIYSSRVDDAHNLVYKFRGGLSTASRAVVADDEDDEENDTNGSEAAVQARAKKDAALRRGGKTLELRAGALAFPIDMSLRLDPLFEKTSAQMDQRKASSLLLSTLPIASGCRIVFDSYDSSSVPSASASVPAPDANEVAAPEATAAPDAAAVASAAARSQLQLQLDLDLSRSFSLVKQAAGGVPLAALR